VGALIAVAVVLALVAGILGVTAAIRLPARGTTCNATTVVADVSPSLVAIGVVGARPTATGTVIRGNGAILTSLAALPDDAASGVAVTLSDGEVLPATLVGTDAATGLAVLRIERQRLPFVLLSPRESVQAGLPVVALGSPLLADSAVLSGTVQSAGSAVRVVGASPWSLANAITTDLTGTAGNTGAPVVTCDSRMIGVVVGWASEGTAVVVPAESAQRVVARLLGLS
jgi:putative serine protease PepD